MKSLSGRHFAKVLERHGWVLARVHGSHHIYTQPNSTVRLSLPIHGNTPLKTGLQAFLMKQAGLTESDL